MTNHTKSALLTLLTLISSVAPAHALNNCVFKLAGKTLYLKGDCTTDETIVVPNGVTFLGGNFTLTAVDPELGNFVGPVVANGGPIMNVTKLHLRTALQDVCNAENDKVVGIQFLNATGSISYSTVSVNKGTSSACEEGIGVDIENSPELKQTVVKIKSTRIFDHQWKGLRANGNVSVRLSATDVTGRGADATVAQEGIEIANGATGQLTKNNIINHRSPALSAVKGTGVALRAPGDNLLVDGSLIQANDRGVLLIGGNKIAISNNRIVDSTTEGVLISDEGSAASTNHKIQKNDSSKNHDGIVVSSSFGLISNLLVKQNITTRNKASGISFNAITSKIQKNTSNTNKVVDITNTGVNSYTGNVCATSNGLPVDCGVAPL